MVRSVRTRVSAGVRRNSLAGLVLVGRLRLAGDGAVTVRRGRSIRYRPIWLISPCQAASSGVDPVTGALGVRELRPAGSRRAPATPRSTRAGACSSVRRRLTVALHEGCGARSRPQPYGPVRRAADFAAFPTGSMRVFTDPTSIRPRYRLGCPFLGSEKWHHLVRPTAFAERWVMGPGSRKEVTDLSEILARLAPCGECGDGHARVRDQDG